MTTASAAGVDSTLLHFDLLPDSAFVPVDTLASLLGVSIATVRRRIADGAIPAPQGVLGLQRYNVGTIRSAILKSFDFIAFDDPNGGFDKRLTDGNYEHQAARDLGAAHDN